MHTDWRSHRHYSHTDRIPRKRALGVINEYLCHKRSLSGHPLFFHQCSHGPTALSSLLSGRRIRAAEVIHRP
jgi:hypothetical protein